MSSRNFIRAMSKLQRAWQTATAALDYVEIYQPGMMATEELKEMYENAEHSDTRSIGACLGAFVWTDVDAMMLYRARLPVYYIRGFANFDQQKILEVVGFSEPRIIRDVASPSYPSIYMGQAGSDAKFTAIRVASVSCFDTASPFENLHLPGTYQSSYAMASGTSMISPSSSKPSTSKAPSSGPIRTNPFSLSVSSNPYKQKPRKGKAKQGGANDPPVNRDLFADPPNDSDFLPPAIPAWQDANRSIDVAHCEKREMHPGDSPRLKTVVPDIGHILGGSDPARRMNYLCQWSHIRQPFLRRRDADEVPIPLRSSVWRKVMSVPFHGLYTKEADPTDRQGRDHQEATQWLKTLFKKYAPGTEVAASQLATVDTASARRLVYELSMVNFWYQLMSLDEIADTTIPVPSPDVSQAEYIVQRASHRRHRLKFIDEVFGGYGDPFSAISLSQEAVSTSQNVGIASERWPDRFAALRSLWRLMDTWPGRKHPLWNRGNDSNLAQMVAEGEQWERVLVHFYVQTYYNLLGFPPVLPRRIM
ncbi:hypothetical protein V5O48_014829 [Marasmius crinis-equi]|uniref:Uncharacterized protein n=1 Tax=Marasmius crinis-equi TaxID=585013 RepID=A0ABR3EW78_9AGAR